MKCYVIPKVFLCPVAVYADAKLAEGMAQRMACWLRVKSRAVT